MSQKLYKDKPNRPGELNEPIVAYSSKGYFELFSSMLQDAARQFNGMKGPDTISDYDVLQRSRQGLSKRILLSLAKKISLTIQELANIMHISERTLQRYDDDAIIKSEYSEKAIELARLYTRGEEVFGSMDKFKAWMKTPSHIFKGETPVSLLDTSFGFNMVFKELGRIEHGIFA